MKRTMLHITLLMLLAVVIPAPVAVGQGQEKVDVCHITGEYEGRPIGHVINIADPAYPSHLAHGDPMDYGTELLEDGTEVCFPVSCPCFTEQDLQDFYEAALSELPGWEVLSFDLWPECMGTYCTMTRAFDPFGELELYIFVSHQWEYLCYFVSYYPPYPRFILQTPVSEPEAKVCRDILIMSQIYQEAGY